MKTKRIIEYSFVALLFVVVIFLVLPRTTDHSRHWPPFEAEYIAMRTALKAIRSYAKDNGEFPLWEKGLHGANNALDPSLPAYSLPTFRVWSLHEEVGTFPTLTTPVAYLEEYPADPFASRNEKKATFMYYSDKGGFILVGRGPDRKYEIVPEIDYDSSIWPPSDKLIMKTYDVTNGLESAGDFIIFSEPEDLAKQENR